MDSGRFLFIFYCNKLGLAWEEKLLGWIMGLQGSLFGQTFRGNELVDS